MFLSIIQVFHDFLKISQVAQLKQYQSGCGGLRTIPTGPVNLLSHQSRVTSVDGLEQILSTPWLEVFPPQTSGIYSVFTACKSQPRPEGTCKQHPAFSAFETFPCADRTCSTSSVMDCDSCSCARPFELPDSSPVLGHLGDFQTFF